MDDFMAGIFVFIFGMTASLFMLFSAFTCEEVDGTVRDKYISNSTQYLLVDYSTGETNDWDIRPEVYEACEVGDSIHRSTDGVITCTDR